MEEKTSRLKNQKVTLKWRIQFPSNTLVWKTHDQDFQSEAIGPVISCHFRANKNPVTFCMNPKKDKVWPEVVKREERAKVHDQIEIISQGQTVCEYISTLKSIKSCD